MKWKIKNFLCSFWGFLLLFVFLAAPLLYFWSEEKIDSQNEYLLSLLHTRADSTLLAVENAVSLFKLNRGEKVSELLRQMAHEPGLAWLTIVSPTGIILADSDPQMIGKNLYTRGEMERLAPSAWSQGRFSLDEPDLYEVWKILRPDNRKETPAILFGAFNSSFVTEELKGYSLQLRWRVLLTSLIFICCLIIGWLFYQYKKSGKLLQDARAVALQIISNFPDGLLVIRPNGKILFFNRNLLQLLKMTGHIPEYTTDLPITDWLDFIPAVPESSKKETTSLELHLADERDLVLSISPIYATNQRPSAYLFVVSDKTALIKQRKKAEEQAKFAALGKIASGLAHEIRNPLGAMCGYAAYLAERLNGDQEGAAIAKLLVEEGSRLNNVLSEILTLTRRQEIKPQPICLSNIFRRLLMLTEIDYKAKNLAIELTTSPPNLLNDYVFLLDADKLLQALLNILINAIHASPPNGKIFVECVYSADKKALVVKIQDEGPGIPEKELPHIFTPYFTTRPEGSGLGLAVAKNIVEGHEGALIALNSPQKGAIFKITIPVIKNNEEQKQDNPDCR